ncbi:hypothetical protein NE237_015942 [Protea cynaroides]|uniref:Uncharacterized protein n=1 Tax=Protea cynaroides TaxID=273540 RepID=A0A9Q0KF73_9MAGN|nr:hypothetical protein NE237_015942 [Protea cynaroides]
MGNVFLQSVLYNWCANQNFKCKVIGHGTIDYGAYQTGPANPAAVGKKLRRVQRPTNNKENIAEGRDQHLHEGFIVIVSILDKDGTSGPSLAVVEEQVDSHSVKISNPFDVLSNANTSFKTLNEGEVLSLVPVTIFSLIVSPSRQSLYLPGQTSNYYSGCDLPPTYSLADTYILLKPPDLPLGSLDPLPMVMV